MAFQAPHIFTPSPTAPKPTTALKPIGIPTFPGAPKLTITWPVGTAPPKPVTVAPPPIVATLPPPSGSPQGQIPNGPSNIPVNYMTDSGGGPAIIPNTGGTGTDSGPLPSGLELSPSGGGGGVSFFASLPWWAWLGLGIAGYYVVKRVSA